MAAKKKTSTGKRPYRKAAPQRSEPPAKLTPTLAEMVTHLVAYGCSIESSAEQCGISRHTFNAWVRRGKAALQEAEQRMPDEAALSVTYRTKLLLAIDPIERPFADFASAVESALGRAEVGYSLAMRRHADDDWRAAAWWLERRNARLYGNRETIRVGAAGPPELATMSNDELVAELGALGFVQVSAANDLGFPLAHVVEAAVTALPASPSHDVSGSGGGGASTIGGEHGGPSNGHGGNGHSSGTNGHG